MLILPMMDILTMGDSKVETKKDYVYVFKDNKILKLYITIDARTLKGNFVHFYNKMLELSSDFCLVSAKEMKEYYFPISMPYVGRKKVDSFYKQKAYQIPGNDDGKLLHNISLIYEYNYNQDRSKNLDEVDLEGLYDELSEPCSSEALSIAKRETIMSIVSNLNVQLVETYDCDEFESALKYIDSIIKKSSELKSKIDLSKLKRIILYSKKYSEILEMLGITIPDKDLENKTKKYTK